MTGPANGLGGGIRRRAALALGRTYAALARKFPATLLNRSAVHAFSRAGGPVAAGAFAAGMLDRKWAGGGRPAVLCLYRLHFARDIQELRRRTAMDWIPVKVGPHSSARLFGWLQGAWVPAAIFQQAVYQGATGPVAAAARRRTDEFGRVFLAEARRRLRVDAVLSANIDYGQEDGLITACRERGIPFLVLCRENAARRESYERALQHYREHPLQFRGTAVAVMSGHHRRLFIAAGLCREDQLHVCGPPRVDLWRDEFPAAANLRRATLFSFANPGYYAPTTFAETLRAFAATARDGSAPGVEFLVKCRDTNDLAAIREHLAAAGAHGVTAVASADFEDLVGTSRVLVGFNSTALLEALLTPLPVIVPAWGEAAGPPDRLLLDPADPTVRRAVTVADSPEGFARALAETAAGVRLVDAETRRARREVFRRFLHLPEDISCSEEVERFVRRFLPGEGRDGAPGPAAGATGGAQ